MVFSVGKDGGGGGMSFPRPLIWKQAEIAETRRSTTVYSASSGRGRGPRNSIYFITDFMWVVPSLAGIQ